jgi:hypothetical protein
VFRLLLKALGEVLLGHDETLKFSRENARITKRTIGWDKQGNLKVTEWLTDEVSGLTIKRTRGVRPEGDSRGVK